MKAIMVMYDTLSRRFLSTYGNTWVKTPNFERLKEKSVQLNQFYAGSLPCMPARRELHTGRYNFLHRGWGPIEPFDISAMELLKKKGIYSHITTDHSHYWEDGGSTYLPRYTTWEGFRGQEGDRWVGMVNASERLCIPKQAETTKAGESFYVNYANRTQMQKEEDFSSVKAFQAGLDFIDVNHEEDNWFLQIESFDPHEPFYVPQKYLDLYEDIPCDVYFDWPPYAPVCESEEEKRQIIIRYAALISMCDAYLGKVLDKMDAYDLWKDTMLIVNTDHGFLTGEHDWWGKNVMPNYNEIVHLPFYLYDPRCPKANEERDSLAQTIDIAPTLLEFFGVDIPDVMQGRPLYPVLANGEVIHDAILFGSHGGHINVCDGTHVYMRSPLSSKNQPSYEYTLMPTMMRGFIHAKTLAKSELTNEFACFQHQNVLKLPASNFMSSYRFGNKLFNVQEDYNQCHPIDDANIEIAMLEKMRLMMIDSEAPKEQYERMGMYADRPLTKEELLTQREERKKQDTIDLPFAISEDENAQILMIKDMLPEKMYHHLLDSLVQAHEQGRKIAEVLEESIQLAFTTMKLPVGIQRMMKNLIQNAGKID